MITYLDVFKTHLLLPKMRSALYRATHRRGPHICCVGIVGYKRYF